jgi:hypothetical protein
VGVTARGKRAAANLIGERRGTSASEPVSTSYRVREEEKVGVFELACRPDAKELQSCYEVALPGRSGTFCIANSFGTQMRRFLSKPTDAIGSEGSGSSEGMMPGGSKCQQDIRE